MMKRVAAGLFVLAFLLGVTHAAALAAGAGTPKEAEALVKKAVAEIKTLGKEKAFAEISNPQGKFVDRDLYIFVYDLDGKCVAHGFNQKLIGKDLINMRDTDGRPYVQERIEIIKTRGKGWQDYKFTNPLTKKIEQKTAYIEKVNDVIVGCGAYKK